MRALSFRLWFFVTGLAAVVIGGTWGFAAVEGLDAVDAFYFTVVTITTVGFGDIHPLTHAGKVLVVVLILAGAGTFTGLVATATEIFLSSRERHHRLEKLNMVIGAFFSEVGVRLLVLFSDADPGLEGIRANLLVSAGWSDREFAAVSERLRGYDYRVEMTRIDRDGLRRLLAGKRQFLLRLVENPTLLEHEEFTDLLLAVFHLTEELLGREEGADLPDSDVAHLGGDIRRVYVMLVHQWLAYMSYLKREYPYLFSLAIRTNPFDQDASAVVQ